MLSVPAGGNSEEPPPALTMEHEPEGHIVNRYPRMATTGHSELTVYSQAHSLGHIPKVVRF